MKLVCGLQYCQLDALAVKHIFQKQWVGIYGIILGSWYRASLISIK